MDSRNVIEDDALAALTGVVLDSYNACLGAGCYESTSMNQAMVRLRTMASEEVRRAMPKADAKKPIHAAQRIYEPCDDYVAKVCARRPWRNIVRLRAAARIARSYVDGLAQVQREGMNATWRSTIITWYHQLKDSSNLNTGTIYVAVNFLDRYLSIKSVNRMNYRLVSLGALFLASKIEEPQPIKAYELSLLSGSVFESCDVRVLSIACVTRRRRSSSRSSS